MKRFNVFYSALCAFCFVALSGFVTKDSGFEKTNQRTFPKHGSAFFGGIVGLDTVRLHLENCGSVGKVCLPLTLGQALQMKITDNGQPVFLDINSGCDFDTSSAYTYSTLFGQGNFGPYELQSWPVGSQVFSDTFLTINELVDSMNQWDPLGNWMHDPAHLLITGGFPGNVYDTMKVWVIQLQTPSFIGYNFGVTPKGSELTFVQGFHTVILKDTINNMSDTFFVHASCSETVNRIVQRDSTRKYCLDFSDLLTAPESVTLCNSVGAVANFQLTNNDSCLNYTGKAIGVEQTCVVACDSTGFCDTTWLNLTVISSGVGDLTEHYLETPFPGVGMLCLDTMNLSGPVEDIRFCMTGSSQFVDFVLAPESNCILFSAKQEGGTDSVCVVACDALGVCDSTFLAVKVRRFGPDFIYDTMFLNQPGSHCVERYVLPGTPQALEVFHQPNPLGLFYNLDHQNFCATWVGLKAGTDTLGVRLRDDGNIYDSTYIIVTILKPDAEFVIDTLEAGEILNFCFSTTQLGGSAFIMDNICKNSSNDDVSFDFNDLTLCLEMQAIKPGTDTACVTICDNLGVCDSVIFYITALDDFSNPQPPVALPDNGIAHGAQPVSIPVLTNDLISPAFTDIFLLPAGGQFGPTHGTVSVDGATGLITYVADSSFCNNTDNFQYVVCNADGCDSAIVTVMVLCDTTPANPNKTITVYPAFSPNGDNVNETFTIKNVEFYTESEVIVYNRWGNEVFHKINYLNDWKGDWEGRKLPDGAYFYYFNDGHDRIKKGVLLIKR